MPGLHLRGHAQHIEQAVAPVVFASLVIQFRQDLDGPLTYLQHADVRLELHAVVDEAVVVATTPVVVALQGGQFRLA